MKNKMIKNSHLKLLTDEEAARLRKHCEKMGSQEKAAVAWFTSSSRISRIINRRHGPQEDFRQKLREAGIILDEEGEK